MTLFITYQELQQLVADKLHKDVELQATDNNALKITLHKEVMGKTVDSSAEMVLYMCDDDLYADYKVVPIDNLKSKFLSGLMDHFAPNLVNLAMDYFQNKYPQFNGIVEKIPNADRLRIHLAAIPQLQNVLHYVKVESIDPQKDGLQINAKMK